MQAGLAAYEVQDWPVALRHLLPLAVKGDAEAQYRISRMYFEGWGLPKDACASTIWAEKAARQGHPFGAWSMSFAYDMPSGVRRNQEMAYRWMVYADKMGAPKAKENLDFMAGELTPEERAAIDEDMKTWDPSKLPAPEYFVIDKSVVNDTELYFTLHAYLKVGPCD
ncbi:MAG: sel1 repeat family protein [Alphaproteobacteria bacterium]|nr:sel1 repeat family protein [Alphaproteobacteria bacterium]